MLIHNAVITGSLTYNGVDISDITGSEGSISALNSFSASMLSYTASNNLASASFSTRVTNLESTASVLTTASASFSIVSQSYASSSGSLSTRVTNTESTGSSLVTASGSFSTRVTDLESTGSSLVAASASFSTRTTNLEATASVLTTASASFSVVSSSFSSTSQSLSNRVTIVEGSYATTGSNVFVGNQGLTSTSNAISFTSTGSLYIDGGARITKDLYVSGTSYFNNVTIYGTQSVNYITSSQLNIGTNIITVNTDTPTVRYGGLAVYDSGSTGLTGSILWDSENNHWIYTNPSASTYSGGMLISGPRASARGCEVGTTSCAVMMGQGGDHITSSAIFHYGNATCFYGTSVISGSGNACFSGQVCAATITSAGTINGTTLYGSTTVCAPTILGTTVVSGSVGCFTSICSPTHVGGTFSGTTVYGSTVVCGATICSSGNSYTANASIVGGCIGVGGTFNPTNPLHIYGDSNTCFAAMKVQNASACCLASVGIEFQLSTDYTDYKKAEIRAIASSQYANDIDLAFWSGGSTAPDHAERMRIRYNGYIQLTGDPYLYSNTTEGGTTIQAGLKLDSTNKEIKFFTNDLGRVLIDTNGIACFACTICAPMVLASGCIGINTTAPDSLLHVLNTSNTPYSDANTLASGQWFRVSNPSTCTGATSGILFVASGPSGGNGLATINGVTTSCGSMAITFATRDASGNVTERMRVASGGAVGIGTTSPYQNLHVYQTGGTGNNYVEGTIQVGGTSSTLGAALSYASQNSGYVNLVNLNTSGGANARISLGFGAISSGLPASTVMTLNQSGYVGIGTCTPSTTLHVRTDDGVLIKGATSDIDAKLSFLPASGGRQYDFRNYGSSFGIKDASADNIRMYFHFNGNIGIGTTSPCALLHIAAPSTNGVLFPAILNNPYNDGVAGYGVGLRLQNSTITGAQETNKWAGIAAIAGGSSGYSNETDLAFYVGCFISAANCTCPPVEKMRIQSSTGNVGIGLTTPQYALSIQRIGNVALHFSTNGCYTGEYIDITGGGNCTVTDGNSAFRIRSVVTAPSGKATGNLGFWVNCGDKLVERMHIGCTGNIGIGITDPGAKLQVKTSVSAGATDAFYIENPSSALFEVRDDGLTYMKGCVGIGTTSPDAPLAVDTQIANFSTGVLAKLYASKGTTEGAYLDIRATRHSTTNIRRVELYAYHGPSCCNGNLVLQPNGGCVGIGTYVPGTTLEVRGTGTTNFAGDKGNLFISPGGTATQGAGCGGTLTFGTWLNGDLSNPYRIAAIRGISESSTTNDNRGALIFGTATTDHSVNICEQMRINSLGNVGVGTQTPCGGSGERTIHLAGNSSTNATIYVTRDTYARTILGTNANGGITGTQSNHNLYIVTNDTARLFINNDGISCFACQVCSVNGFRTGDNSYLTKSTIRLRSSNNNKYLDLQATDTCAIIASNFGDSDVPLILGSWGGYQNNQLFLSTNCNVGIWTNSPSYRLDVSGAARVGTLLVSNATTTTWCVGRINDAKTDCWYSIFGWNGIYDGAFAIIQLGYEDNNGDGANTHALWMTTGAAYSTGFSTSLLGGAGNLCTRRNGQCLEVLITGVDCRASGSYIGFTVQSMNVAS